MYFLKSLLSINFSKNAHFIEEIRLCPEHNLRPLFPLPPLGGGLFLKTMIKNGVNCVSKSDKKS